MGDEHDEGGEAPCLAHLLDEDGRLDPSAVSGGEEAGGDPAPERASVGRGEEEESPCQHEIGGSATRS